MENLYNRTITIVNKLKKADTVAKTTDEFVKTVITGCEIHRVSVKNVSGTTVSIGQAVKVLIPFDKGFLKYADWKSDTTKGYTVNQGDIVFLDMSLSEVPTASNITSLKNSYYPNSCDMRSFREAKDNGIATVQIMIEGV